MPVNNPFALVSGIQYVDGTPITAGSFTGTVAMSWNGSDVVGLRSDGSDNLLVNVAAFSGVLTVTGNLTHNSAVPAANNVGALVAVASSAAPTYNAGDQVLLSTDLSGNLRVNIGSVVASNNITEWASTLLGVPTVYGTAPTGNVVIGVNAFVTNTVAVSQSGTWTVQQGGAPWSVSQSGTWNVGLNAGANNIGSVNQGTSPWVVSLTSTTITGTVAVTQSTSPWTVQGDSASGAANAGNPVKTGAVFNTTQPTVTNGQTVDNQATARGALIVATGVDTFNVTVNTALPAGGNTIGAVTQASGPWTINLTQVDGTTLGAPSAYGTSPGAVNVIGVNAFITNTVAVSGTITANQGGAPWTQNLTQVGGVAVAATAKGVQGTNAIPVQELKDTGRNPIVLTVDAVAAITTEALATISINSGGTVTSATHYTVTAGKTFRVQSVSVSIQETNSTVQWTKFRFRSAGTVTATSPIFAATQIGTSGATGNVGQGTVPIPDGMEFAAGQQVGISHVESSTSAAVTYCVIGYEY